MGINQVAAIGGSFIGLIAGGLLSVVDWRLVFWVSVPFGVLGTIWATTAFAITGSARRQDRLVGNLTFAVGLTSILVGIVYGIQPYLQHSMGWTSPRVLSAFLIGVVFLVAFFIIENRVESPMFNLRLFKMRAFSTGSTPDSWRRSRAAACSSCSSSGSRAFGCLARLRVLRDAAVAASTSCR